MRTLVLAYLCCLIINELSSQNLIPNGSFELERDQINGMITISREAFNNKTVAWYSPTKVSPDILLPHPDNANFPDQFKLPEAIDGQRYIGLILDNPYDACKTYKEYVQVKLKDTLEIGTTYFLEFWVNAYKNDLFNLGVFFSENKLVNNKCSMLLNTAQVSFKDSLIEKEWKKISFEIIPSEPYTYITVGNFDKSEDPKRRYCYFDDFRLWKKGTTIAISKEFLVQEDNKIQVNEPIVPTANPPAIEAIFNANNIQFEHGKSDLSNTSLLELEQLISYLKTYPDLKILIEGHTDNSGSALVNKQLSAKRVESVMSYMQKKGITPDRMKYISHGASEPIASNETEEGRRLNRRVTFLLETH